MAVITNKYVTRNKTIKQIKNDVKKVNSIKFKRYCLRVYQEVVERKEQESNVKVQLQVLKLLRQHIKTYNETNTRKGGKLVYNPKSLISNLQLLVKSGLYIEAIKFHLEAEQLCKKYELNTSKEKVDAIVNMYHSLKKKSHFFI